MEKEDRCVHMCVSICKQQRWPHLSHYFNFDFICFYLLCIPRKYQELTLYFHLSLPLWEADLFSTPWISEQISEKQRRNWDYHPQIPAVCCLQRYAAALYTVIHTRQMKGSLICVCFLHPGLFRPKLNFVSPAFLGIKEPVACGSLNILGSQFLLLWSDHVGLDLCSCSKALKSLRR